MKQNIRFTKWVVILASLMAILVSGCTSVAIKPKHESVMNIWISPEYVAKKDSHHPYISVAVYNEEVVLDSSIASGGK